MKLFWLVNIILVAGLCAVGAQPSTISDKKADVTVAKDGSGNVKTVTEAIAKVPENNQKRFVIFIKPGIYKEQIRIPADKPYISLIGESAEKTILTFDLTNKAAGSTSASYSFYVGGHDFYAENLTFENSFGKGSQAVAVLTEADRLIFKNCRFLGWQDTLYAKNGRQYFENCYIEGAVDFIFGQAAAFFENCEIHSKGDGFIAAPMRFAANEPSGLIFNNCRLTGENIGEKGVFLGRPWRDYGRTVYLNTKMDAHILAAGWNNWLPEREKTAYFAEYNSTGAGAKTNERAKWTHQLSKNEAEQFSADNFLKSADGWNHQTSAGQISNDKLLYSSVSWHTVLKQSKEWYATDEAARIADQVLLYQKENGGWEKNLDMAAMLTETEKSALVKAKGEGETTIDNNATTTQISFLAKVITASLAKPTPPNNFSKHKAAFFKGLDYLFAAQYENGGYPQFFPLRQGYYTHITYNDDAMVNVLKLLRDIAAKKEEFLFVDEDRRTKADQAVAKGITVILKTQIAVKGEKTVWCAQHSETTLLPAPARKFEPISLSGYESVGIVEFLMSVKNPSPQIVAAVDSAVRWFEKSKIKGIKIVEKPDKSSPKGFDRIVVKDERAEPLWARFYDIETNRPIFVGRDSVNKDSLAEIEIERRSGYNYYTAAPNKLLEDYPRWKNKNRKD